jgi:hypothetical protein
MMSNGIEKCLVINTSHVTEEDFNFLMECRNDQALVWPEKRPLHGYGLWLYVSAEIEYIGHDSMGRQAIKDIMLYAHKHNCNYVRLSNEGDIIDELKQYDWE